jgi:predicted TIM-barrel fold metal-dependent hydrolase
MSVRLEAAPQASETSEVSETSAMPIADAHHHLWDLSRGRYPWLQDDYDAEAFFLGDYTALCRDFLPQDYRAASRGCNVVATVHIEAERDRAEQVAETAWLHEVHAQHGFPNAVVAHAWFDRPESEERLLEQSRFPLVRGIRSKPVTGRTPADRVDGLLGTMQDDAWLRGFALLKELGLSWDLRVPAWHLPQAAEVAAAFPEVPIVLNHHAPGTGTTTRASCATRSPSSAGSAACSRAIFRWPACASISPDWSPACCACSIT